MDESTAAGMLAIVRSSEKLHRTRSSPAVDAQQSYSSKDLKIMFLVLKVLKDPTYKVPRLEVWPPKVINSMPRGAHAALWATPQVTAAIFLASSSSVYRADHHQPSRLFPPWTLLNSGITNSCITIFTVYSFVLFFRLQRRPIKRSARDMITMDRRAAVEQHYRSSGGDMGGKKRRVGVRLKRSASTASGSQLINSHLVSGEEQQESGAIVSLAYEINAVVQEQEEVLGQLKRKTGLFRGLGDRFKSAIRGTDGEQDLVSRELREVPPPPSPRTKRQTLTAASCGPVPHTCHSSQPFLYRNIPEVEHVG